MDKYLISYDITKDRNRNQIRKMLLGYGIPVQYSVFECFLTKTEYKELIDKITKVFKKFDVSDSVRIYPLCKDCNSKIHIIGSGDIVSFDDKPIII